MSCRGRRIIYKAIPLLENAMSRPILALGNSACPYTSPIYPQLVLRVGCFSGLVASKAWNLGPSGRYSGQVCVCEGPKTRGKIGGNSSSLKNSAYFCRFAGSAAAGSQILILRPRNSKISLIGVWWPDRSYVQTRK